MRALVEASRRSAFPRLRPPGTIHSVNRILQEQDYGRLKGASKGLVRRYPPKITGLSRRQVARWIRCYPQGFAVKPRAYRRHRFPQRCTRIDIELLAEVDEAHEKH